MMETATTTTTATLRHRKGDAAAVAAGAAGATSSGISTSTKRDPSLALAPLPISPPTASGKRLLNEEADGKLGAAGGAGRGGAETPSTASTAAASPPPKGEGGEEEEIDDEPAGPLRPRAPSFGPSMTEMGKFSRLFYSSPGESAAAPPAGPAMIDMAKAPAHPVVQAIDLLVLFLIVHYVQIFYGTIFYLLWLYRQGDKTPLMVAAAIYLPFYLIPIQRLGGWKGRILMNRPFWRCIQRALRIKLEREAELDPSRQYIFGWHPHGILLLSRFAIYGGLWQKVFPGIHFKTLAASPLFWIPPIREVSLLLGGVDAGRAFAKKAIRDGYSVSLYPGGSKEIYTTDPDTPKTQLVLKIRKGFIRLALHYGIPLVPVYIYGEKYAYNTLGHLGLGRWLLSVLRVPFLVFWGRWCTFMPLKGTEVAVVVGKPLEVPRVENPSPELVERYLDKYCGEVQALFDRHKHKYGKPDEYLEIS